MDVTDDNKALVAGYLNGYILYFKKVKTCKTRGHNNLYRNTDH